MTFSHDTLLLHLRLTGVVMASLVVVNLVMTYGYFLLVPDAIR